MTPIERRVIQAAVALCKAGRGFCFGDDGKISNMKIAKRLENAVEKYHSARKRLEPQSERK